MCNASIKKIKILIRTKVIPKVSSICYTLYTFTKVKYIKPYIPLYTKMYLTTRQSILDNIIL